MKKKMSHTASSPMAKTDNMGTGVRNPNARTTPVDQMKKTLSKPKSFPKKIG